MCRFHKRVTVEAECIICMDTERDCLLSPCCHLATCTAASATSSPRIHFATSHRLVANDNVDDSVQRPVMGDKGVKP